MKKRIMIIAGETSGDLHAGALIRACQQSSPHPPALPKHTTTTGNIPSAPYHFYGIAGSYAKSQGMHLLMHCQQLATMGLIETLTFLPKLITTYHTVKRLLKQDPPDLLILIDFASFNLKIAQYAKRQGIRTLYLIPPKVWASRARRLKTIKQSVDHVAVIFPFEQALYAKHQIPVSYVGNTLVNKIADFHQHHAQYHHNHSTTAPVVITLMPGSRLSEIQRIFPNMVETCAQLQQRHPNIHFNVIVAQHIQLDMLRAYVNERITIKFVHKNRYQKIIESTLVIAASGTATLEVALLHTPMVVVYRLSPITYWIAKKIINLRHISLCNILAEKEIVPEYIQHAFQPQQLADDITALLADPQALANMKKAMRTLSDQLASYPNVSLATCISQVITSP